MNLHETWKSLLYATFKVHHQIMILFIISSVNNRLVITYCGTTSAHCGLGCDPQQHEQQSPLWPELVPNSLPFADPFRLSSAAFAPTTVITPSNIKQRGIKIKQSINLGGFGEFLYKNYPGFYDEDWDEWNLTVSDLLILIAGNGWEITKRLYDLFNCALLKLKTTPFNALCVWINWIQSIHK